MNAIVPLNVAALRVNKNDSTNVVGKFQGKTALFENMPWSNPNSQPPPNLASTGDKIFNALGEVNGNPVYSPRNPLGVGVHLHWELPDYFRRGKQPSDGSKLQFPAVPNRWLVTRFLSFYDSTKGTYGPITTKSWVVESDYLSPTLSIDSYGMIRPAITVPIPPVPAFQKQPFMYMGRVVDYSAWNPVNEKATDFLPSYGTQTNPLYLTSIGFVGAYFGSYYPECSSVFGFWDHFADVPFPGYKNLNAAMNANEPVQFRASYSVMGWLNEAGADPLVNIDQDVTTQFNDYVNKCNAKGVQPTMTPLDFFRKIMNDKMRWTYNGYDVGFTPGAGVDNFTLNLPTRTICQGLAQEVVWNMLSNTGTTYFLRSNVPPGGNGSVWDSQVEISIGNSVEETVSVLLKYDMGDSTDDPDVLTNYELLLDAVQLGLLPELEKAPNKLIALEEAVHSLGFATQASGYLWIIGTQRYDDSAPSPDDEATIPLQLAEKLYLLNQAQKNYDQGRAALSVARRQLFMDWTHYLKMYTGEIKDPNIQLNAMTNFILTSNAGELTAVVNQGTAAGILSYVTDNESGAVVAISPPVGGVSTNSLAYAVWNNYNIVLEAVKNVTGMVLQCTKAPSFFQPSEPVVLMEGDMMEPVARNGSKKTTFIRLSPEILSVLDITYAQTNFKINTGNLSGVPVISNITPMQGDLQALMGENYLVTPMLSSVVTSALAAKGGSQNPAVISASNFASTLMYAQGGLSPLDQVPYPGGIPTPVSNASLFALVGGKLYSPAANPVIAMPSPQNISFIFTNANTNGWPPNIIGWRTQAGMPEFTSPGYPFRVDPFMPIFMVWTLKLNPLQWLAEDSNKNSIYSPANLTQFFEMDDYAVDYKYLMEGGQPANFTSPLSVNYGNSSTMNSNSAGVLVYQINSYIAKNPDDPENPTLQKLADLYGEKKFLSQAISGFNVQQVLQTLVAQVGVSDLTKGPKDSITTRLAAEAIKNAFDNWYNFSFNSLEPITTGLLAQGNFGPMRSGFMEVIAIEIVDVFGQRMDLATAEMSPSGGLNCIPSYALAPQKDDEVNQGKIFLPPRVLSPSRLWFQWLSATFDPSVSGITGDFEEMSAHPSTSPVCGWIMPNHLDDNLFFYNSDGSPIGSFGIEHQGTSAQLKYRTRPGNIIDNPTSSLAVDIGNAGSPTKNANLCNFMWYINGQDAQYLNALMHAILNSAAYINPANYSQDASLSVLIGRPLALVRAVAGIETAGGVLPISNANNGPGSPLPQDVNNNRVQYGQRMQNSSAALGAVNFPLRLGDLANLDDGLVGYIMDGTGSNPYTGKVFYAPAADDNFTSPGVKKPEETTLQLNLNATATKLTMLVDPRAPVHGTTGILPVKELAIPPDQYSVAMSKLAMSFTARPMLKMAQRMIVPLPAEAGYSWAWITPGQQNSSALNANEANETPIYGYTPQTLQEGWLELKPDEKK